MGSSAAVVRAVATATAMPTEFSSATVARYVVSYSATPTARGFLEAVIKTLRSLAPLGASYDLHFSTVAARAGGDGAGYDRSGSEVAIRPRALSYQLATRARELPFLVAARADGDGAGYDRSGSEVAIRRPALSYQFATRPRELPFLVAARAVEDGDGYRSGSEVSIRSRSHFFPLSDGVDEDGDGSLSAVATRPRAPTFFPAAICSAYGSEDNDDCDRSISAVANRTTGTRSPSFMVGTHPRAPIFPAGSAGPLINRRKCLSRPNSLYSAISNDRRFASNWAWTPWEQKKPKEILPSPLGVDDVVKFLRELKATSENDAKLKEAFFEKFYSGKTYDAKSVEMKLDLILYKLD